MAGDFGVSVTELTDVIDYCIKLELLFNLNGFVNSNSLDKRLLPVYEKRKVAKQSSEKQLRKNGSFCSSNSDVPNVNESEIPQSKVKEIEVNKTIPEGEFFKPAPIQILMKMWINAFPKYESMPNFDYTALREMFQFFFEVNDISKVPEQDLTRLMDWFIHVVQSDPFYRTKPLRSIKSNMQKIKEDIRNLATPQNRHLVL